MQPKTIFCCQGMKDFSQSSSLELVWTSHMSEGFYIYKKFLPAKFRGTVSGWMFLKDLERVYRAA